MTLKLGMQHRVHKYYQVCSNDDPRLTLTYFTAWSNFLLLKLATDYQSDKKFLLTSKVLSPGGCMPPAPGLYTCFKS